MQSIDTKITKKEEKIINREFKMRDVLISLIVCLLFVKYIGINFFTFFLLMFFLTLVYQVKIFKKEKQESCLVAFRTNNISGFILFLSIYLL